MRSKSNLVVVAVVLICFSVQMSVADISSFQGLGHLWEYDKNSSAYGVSGDGSTVVGFSVSDAGLSNAVMWKDGQMDVLADGRSSAFDVSFDGTMAVGSIVDDAAYWENGAMVTLTKIGTGITTRGISTDGTIIVGDNSGSNPVVWRNGTPTILDDLPGGNIVGTANAVSDNGLTAVGFSTSSYDTEAVYWDTVDGSVHKLGYVSDDYLGNKALNISPDGTMIVGYEGYSHYQEAFLWKNDDMIALGRLGLNHSHALAVSNTGIVVGMAEIDNHDNAFIWDEVLGMRDFKQVLTAEYSLDLTGWQLLKACDISADGTVIVGSGINPDGYHEAWIATIPEPATFLLLGLGSLVLRKRK